MKKIVPIQKKWSPHSWKSLPIKQSPAWPTDQLNVVVEKLSSFPPLIPISEIDILKKLDHPRMMNLRDVFEDKDKLYIVTDLYDGDELFDRILYMETFTESQAAAMFREILDGLNYLLIHH